MILTDLLDLPVFDADGHRLGIITDTRFVIDGAPGQLLADARVMGIIVSPHRRQLFLGYERTTDQNPALLARFLRWRERDAFLVLWKDIAAVKRNGVTMRQRATRYTPLLPDGK